MSKKQGVDPNSKPVMVTTEFRGVFFGYMEEMPTNGTITIKQAQNCVYWSSDVRGFMGLAATGPTKNCKVGPAVPSLTLNKVTAVVEVTPEAADVFALPVIHTTYWKGSPCGHELTIGHLQPLWIEIKSPTGCQTPQQRSFQVEVESRGCYYLLANSVDVVASWLKEHGL